MATKYICDICGQEMNTCQVLKVEIRPMDNTFLSRLEVEDLTTRMDICGPCRSVLLARIKEAKTNDC